MKEKRNAVYLVSVMALCAFSYAIILNLNSKQIEPRQPSSLLQSVPLPKWLRDKPVVKPETHRGSKNFFLDMSPKVFQKDMEQSLYGRPLTELERRDLARLSLSRDEDGVYSYSRSLKDSTYGSILLSTVPPPSDLLKFTQTAIKLLRWQRGPLLRKKHTPVDGLTSPAYPAVFHPSSRVLFDALEKEGVVVRYSSRLSGDTGAIYSPSPSLHVIELSYEASYSTLYHEAQHFYLEKYLSDRSRLGLSDASIRMADRALKLYSRPFNKELNKLEVQDRMLPEYFISEQQATQAEWQLTRKYLKEFQGISSEERLYFTAEANSGLIYGLKDSLNILYARYLSDRLTTLEERELRRLYKKLKFRELVDKFLEDGGLVFDPEKGGIYRSKKD